MKNRKCNTKYLMLIRSKVQDQSFTISLSLSYYSKYTKVPSNHEEEMGLNLKKNLFMLFPNVTPE